MHELSMIADLIEKVESLARENSATKVVAIDVSVGALAGIEPDHLREHFETESAGTLAEGAQLRISVSEDPAAPESHSLLLQSVELEQ